MKNSVALIFGAIITAILSTTCCLPALLFLCFGVSSSFLTYFTSLEHARVPLAIISIICFIVAFINLRKKVSCYKSIQSKIATISITILLFLLIICLLLYPEILPLILE